jgi:ribosomal protein S18 acetylase RimI-like enzyme
MLEFHTIIGGIDLLPVIRPLREQLYSDLAKAIPGFASEFTQQRMDKYDAVLADGNRTKAMQVLLTQSAYGIPVAYCLSIIKSDGNAEIDSLFVDEKYRRLGIAAELTRRAIEWMQSHGTGHISVRVLPVNATAKALYSKLGFVARSLIMRLEYSNQIEETSS